MSKVDEIRNQIEELSKQLDEIQAECKHPEASLDVKHKGDTGNYDPNNDCYWVEYKCGLCWKFWKVDE